MCVINNAQINLKEKNMDDMELDGTPSKQPEDPFKGDAKVTAEKPQDPFDGDEAVAAEQPAPAQAEQVEQAEPVTAEAQPQPAAEAAAEEKPKWQKIVGKVSIILIAVAGLLSALFMCLLSYQVVGVGLMGGKVTQSLMLTDVTKDIQDLAKAMEALGSDASMSQLAGIMGSVLFDAYIMMAMVMGIITGIICGIMLIVKAIKQFAMKKETTLEKTAITSCLFFFADAAILLCMAMRYFKEGSEVMGTNQYGAATLAGLIICGILFAAYFIGKIAANYQQYFSDKTKLINGCMNLAWAVIAMLVLALLTCAPVMATAGGESAGYGFSYVFSSAFAEVLRNAENTSADLSSEAAQYMYAAVGMVLQIWFIFQTGKSLHGAMRGTVSADKAVKLGSQIWRLVFSVIYLTICAALSKEYFSEGATISLAAPIVILIFSVIGLVLAIVNKILVKEQANKKEI